METFSCPACESKIAADGQALVERSDRLVELEKLETLVPRAVKEIAKLRAKLKETPPAPAPAPGPKPKPGQKRKPKVKLEGEDANVWEEFFGTGG